MTLIGNAIKFTEQGEVDISVSAAASDGNVALTFLVRDTGIGIAAEHVASVFKEFTQADSTMTRRYGGTGLGLAISQRLVRLMGGELTVKSVVGRGSEFSFSLALPVETSPPTRLVGLAALGGRRSLIGEHNRTNRRIPHGMLAAEGIHVDEASTAAEGLEALRRVRYDLAILDVQMPDMDGFQLATAVRADKKIKGTNLLMLTSAGQRGDGERCRELGIRGYLTKPISRSDLLEALGTVLAGPPGEAGTPEGGPPPLGRARALPVARHDGLPRQALQGARAVRADRRHRRAEGRRRAAARTARAAGRPRGIPHDVARGRRRAGAVLDRRHLRAAGARPTGRACRCGCHRVWP